MPRPQSQSEPQLDRRRFLAGMSATIAGSWPLFVAAQQPKQACTLGCSTYAIPDRPIADAIDLVAKLGYDSVEITVMPDRDASPDRLSPLARTELRKRLEDSGLQLTSLMGNLRLTPKVAAEHTERLKSHAKLAHALRPDHPPHIQTVLGGKNWENEREAIRDGLGAWLDVASAANVVVCIKPHRGHAMSRPEHFIWLFDQLGKPDAIRMVYDYSHFVFRDMPLVETVEAALPVTAAIAVKDTVQDNGKTRFVLPGEAGTIDYPAMLSRFAAGGFSGDVCVEVSSQVWKQPGYDPVAALTTSYRNMATAFERAGVLRP